jgi:hypothetical protein
MMCYVIAVSGCLRCLGNRLFGEDKEVRSGLAKSAEGMLPSISDELVEEREVRRYELCGNGLDRAHPSRCGSR